jgi:hypothetical protein
MNNMHVKVYVTGSSYNKHDDLKFITLWWLSRFEACSLKVGINVYIS